jgi:hypothetical protein
VTGDTILLENRQDFGLEEWVPLGRRRGSNRSDDDANSSELLHNPLPRECSRYVM